MRPSRPRARLGPLLLLAACGPGIERNPALNDLLAARGPGTVQPPRQPAGPATGTPDPRLCGWLGSDGVRAIAAMPDGQSFAVGYASGRIAFISPEQATRLRAFDAHLSPIEELAISPDGAWLASLEQEGTAKLWDARTGEARHEIAGRRIDDIAFSPDGASLAAVGYPDVLLVRVADGSVAWAAPHTTGTAAAFFSGDGATVLAGSDVLVSYRASDGSRLREVAVRPYGVRAVSSDGALLLGFRSRTSSAALLRIEDGAVLWDQPGATGGSAMEGAAFSPDGASVAYATRTGPVVIVRTTDGTSVRTLEEGVRAVAYAPDGRTIALGLDSGAFNVWDLESGQPRVKQTGAPGHTEQVVQVAASPDGKLIASMAFGARDETLKVWRASDGALLHSSTHPNVRDPSPESFAFSPDSTLLVRTGENDRRVHVVRAEDGTPVRSLDVLPGAPADDHEDATSIAISPDGLVLAFTGYMVGQPVVKALRVADGGSLNGFVHPMHQAATGVVFSPDGSRLAANTDLLFDGPSSTALSLYRTGDRALLWTRDTGPGAIGGVPRGVPAFSPDGTLVAAPDPAIGIRVFASADGALVADLPAPQAAGAAFSPAGDRLAVATGTGLRVYRTDDWSMDSELRGAFRSVAYSPDGATLLAGGLDGTVRLLCDVTASGR
jgi:WD40 repeat protein